MESAPYISEAERTRRILIERYMRLNHNYIYDSGCEKYPWLDDSAKNRYDTDVNVNNWMEERHDVNYIRQKTQALNDFDHAYETEYMFRFGKDAVKGNPIPNSRAAQSFPGHQPQLDLPQLKKVYDSYETTSRVAFQDPGVVTTREPQIQCSFCRLKAGRA